MTGKTLMEKEIVAWRYRSSAPKAKWTVQKNEPKHIATWPGYTVEPLYSAATIRSLQERAERLERALEPFAGSDMAPDIYDDDSCVAGCCDFTCADIRHARSLLSLQSGEEQNSPGADNPNDKKWPEAGDKMTFLNKNGYPRDLEEAQRLLTEGQILTVRDFSLGQWNSTISFYEVKGHFNSVMFAPVPSKEK